MKVQCTKIRLDGEWSIERIEFFALTLFCVFLCLPVMLSSAAEPELHAWQQPVTDDGNPRMLISNFEPGEQIWKAYDQNNELKLFGDEKTPDGYFGMGDIQPGYDNVWQKSVTEGFDPVTEPVKFGSHSIKWSNTPEINRIVTNQFPRDWSNYNYVSLWIYSEKATGAGIEFVCYSENLNAPKDDYYKKEILITWEGWRLVEMPFEEFGQVRAPLGWYHIDYIKIASTGWSHTPDPETILYLDQLQLTRNSLKAELLRQATPIEFPNSTHPSLFTNPKEIAEIKQKIEQMEWATTVYDRLTEKYAAYTVAVPETGGGFYHNEGDDTYEITQQHYEYSRAAQEMALLYQLDGEPRYLEGAKEILIQYAEKYHGYEYHDKNGNVGDKADGGGKATSQAINEARWIMELADAYDMIYNEFTPAEREALETGLFRVAADLIVKNNEGRHNHQAWYNAAAVVMGFLLQDEDYVRYGIYGEDNGFLFQLKASITEDGLWYENSGHYQFYTMGPLLALSEAAYHNGLNFYENQAYQAYFTFPLAYQNPRHELPIINDGRRVILTTDDRTRYLEVAYARMGDKRLIPILQQSPRTTVEALRWGVPKFPEGEPGVLTSSLINNSLAVLRSPDNSLYATMNGLLYAGGHSHLDKLAITLFAHDQVVAPDAGSVKYREPVHTDFLKLTIAHNTVVQDWRRQAYGKGAEVIRFATGPLVQMIRMVDNSVAYEGTLMDRTLLMTDGYLLDFFKLNAEAEHHFDWVYRNKGQLQIPFELQDVTLLQENGYQYLQHSQGVTLTGDIEISWNLAEGKSIELVMFNDQSTDVITVKAPQAAVQKDVLEPKPYQAVLIGREGKELLFSSLLFPSAIGDRRYVVEKISIEQTLPFGGAFKIRNTQTGVEDLILYNRGETAEIVVGEYVTDAATALIRRLDGATYVFLSQAHYFTFGDKEILIDPGPEQQSLVHLMFRDNELELVTEQAGMPMFQFKNVVESQMPRFYHPAADGEKPVIPFSGGRGKFMFQAGTYIMRND